MAASGRANGGFCPAAIPVQPEVGNEGGLHGPHTALKMRSEDGEEVSGMRQQWILRGRPAAGWIR